jgi:hypothetical protein
MRFANPEQGHPLDLLVIGPYPGARKTQNVAQPSFGLRLLCADRRSYGAHWQETVAGLGRGRSQQRSRLHHRGPHRAVWICPRQPSLHRPLRQQPLCLAFQIAIRRAGHRPRSSALNFALNSSLRMKGLAVASSTRLLVIPPDILRPAP